MHFKKAKKIPLSKKGGINFLTIKKAPYGAFS